MAQTTAPWLATMREITGTKEEPGSGDNPVILAFAKYIGDKYPEYAAYARGYTHDSIAWCGLTMAYVMAKNNIKPVKEFLWADNWRKFGHKLTTPVPGAVLTFSRTGGNHVTLYESTDGDYYVCRGGNQSDMVNTTRIAKERCTGIMWPEEQVRPAVVPTVTPATKQIGITATVFGGKDDPNPSAYGGVVNGRELGVALPYRFIGPRPKVRVYRNGKSVDCPIVDVGPWNTHDAYWEKGRRPQAESGTDTSNRVTNGAGIDLTPATAEVLGLSGKGKVDWEFAVPKVDKGPTTGEQAAKGTVIAGAAAGAAHGANAGWGMLEWSIFVACAVTAIAIVFLVFNRIQKGKWLWQSSTGEVSQEQSLPSHPLSERYLEQVSGHLEGSLVASQATLSPRRSGPSQRQKLLAKLSRKTQRQTRSSKPSKRRKASKSLRKRT